MKNTRWTAEQITLLSERYATTPTHELAEMLGKTNTQVLTKAGHMGIRKKKNFRRDRSGQWQTMKKHRQWTVAELTLLEERYPDRPTQEIADAIGCSRERVHTKASRLKIKKSAAFLAGPFSGQIKRGSNEIYRTKKICRSARKLCAGMVTWYARSMMTSLT